MNGRQYSDATLEITRKEKWQRSSITVITRSIIDQLPSLLVLMYKSRLALPLLELAACLPAAVLLLATLVSHAMGPGFSESGESVSPSPWASGPALRAPLVFKTAMRAAERRAFCFSNASSRSRRASIRAAARVVLLLDEDEDAVRRSWVVMCGRGLLRDEEVLCWLRS